MPTFSYRLLAQVIPGTSASQIYAATNATSQTIIRRINAINTTTTDVTYTLFQNGSSAINKISSGDTKVPRNDGFSDGAVIDDCYYTLAPGNSIWAKAGMSNVIVMDVWGVIID